MTDTKDIPDCATDPIAGIETMFVDMVQKGRLKAGQCPAKRPVFLKPHGVAHGTFTIRPDLPDDCRVGLFKGDSYPIWARFSSDTQPTDTDYKSTCGIGIKLFDVPGDKILGQPCDTTFDFILQFIDVFFVDTAQDMCAFTRASFEGKADDWLKDHPRTQEILNAMERPVGSVLGTPYWSIMPFAFGPDRFVKYKLEPLFDDAAPGSAPDDPGYLGTDLAQRLKAAPQGFRFLIQPRTDPDKEPLDQATVAWDSPFVHVADITFPQQDITERGQATYGENLAMNIWRVTADHTPQGSIAEARRVVYAASADVRRDANGIPKGEPAHQKAESPYPSKDTTIVRAAIHPGIGVARMGDADSAFFIGPEVTTPPSHDADHYRDDSHALKRQGARFRIYGYNAAGEVVRELTAANADITWTVELANRKADWYRFITAMDIPETADLSVIQRNKDVTDRASLALTPGARSISGASKPGVAFDDARFKDTTGIYLGEIQTDDAGRLVVLGGRGVSKSPSGKPPFDPADPDSFNNANDWYDDSSDGPVSASVTIDGTAIPVDEAWVVVAPPNYAPDIVGWRTFHDLLCDVYVNAGMMPVPPVTSFTRDVLPQLARLSNLQWVNAGFATMFGKGGPMDFDDPAFVGRLAAAPGAHDTWRELRQQVLNAFRPHDTAVNEPRIWPWIYGDDFGGDLDAPSPRTMLDLPSVQELHLQRWVRGDFEADYSPDATHPTTLDDVPLPDQPEMLDRAALHFCLADAFHPGCEMTWPMRHATMYRAPFRIRRRPDSEAAPDYGPTLSSKVALGPNGPLHAQSPGDITRWMGLPWQGDTAYCRSGYDPAYDPYLPTFWPARVPNHVLTEDDYKTVVDDNAPRADRLAAYTARASWYRFIDDPNDKPPVVPKRMDRMIATFGEQGVVLAKPGVKDDPDFPPVLYVESLPPARQDALAKAARLAAAPSRDGDSHALHVSGWKDRAHLDEAVALRRREK